MEEEQNVSAKKDNYLVAAQELLSSIKKNDVTLDNFHQKLKEVEQTIKVLETTISNLYSESVTKGQLLNTEWDNVKKNPDKIYNDYLPKRIVDLQDEYILLFQKVYSYKSIEQEISRVAYMKFADLLILANAQSNQRDLLKEMKGMQETLIQLTVQSNQVVVKNALTSIQRIADVMSLQNRTNTQVLGQQSQDVFNLFMELLMRLRLNNVLPESDVKELSLKAKENKKEFSDAVREIQSDSGVKLGYDEAPELPEQPKKPVEQVAAKKKQQGSFVDDDTVGEE